MSNVSPLSRECDDQGKGLLSGCMDFAALRSLGKNAFVNDRASYIPIVLPRYIYTVTTLLPADYVKSYPPPASLPVQ